MSSEHLTAVSYTVLGLVQRCGHATPYDLKRQIARSIGFFWGFPHSQLYAEPARLAAEGYLEERRERGGRRRRTYRITRKGRAALERWLRQPTEEPTQIRDLGLLKLFFADLLGPADVRALAGAQERTHRGRLEVYEELERELDSRGETGYARETLRMGLLAERAFVRFWSGIASRPLVEADRREERAEV